MIGVTISAYSFAFSPLVSLTSFDKKIHPLPSRRIYGKAHKGQSQIPLFVFLL